MNIRSFLWAVTLSAVGAFSGMAWGQDNTGAGQGAGGGGGQAQGPGAGMRRQLDFLSADEKQHLMRVRREVMSSDPELKAEQETLSNEWQAVHAKGTDATPEQKEALRDHFMAHAKKMNAAMVKADPTVQPILDKVKAHMQEGLQKRAGGGGGAGDDAAK